jgi:hypothetical protein
MSTESIAPKTVAIIYDGRLLDPLGGLGAYISSEVAHFTSELNPVLINLKSFVQQHFSERLQDPKDNSPEDAFDYDYQAFQGMMSQHAGYFFVFPGHVWSHTRSLKHLVSRLPRYVYANKPTALVTYTREDTRPWYQNEANQSYEHVPRNSAPMMAEFLSQLAAPEDLHQESLSHPSPAAAPSKTGRRRGFNLVQIPPTYNGLSALWPNFVFFWNIWDEFPSSNPVWPGGNQIEAWESPGWGRCITVATIMKDIIER